MLVVSGSKITKSWDLKFQICKNGQTMKFDDPETKIQSKTRNSGLISIQT